MDTSGAAEDFRSLLLRDRGRTGLIQRDLAARSGVSLRSIQDWEAGVTLPTAERLKALIRTLRLAGGLTPGRETSEARELWNAVQRESPRMHAAFDEEWFAGMLAPGPARSTPAISEVDATQSATARAQDWGEAPDTTSFVGRTNELALIQRWVLQEDYRLVAVLGFGGIGKTSLAAAAAQQLSTSFERIYWRSLRNAPPVSEWLAGAIGFLSDQRQVPPTAESETITTLLSLLRARRCLLVLDNSETLFEPGQSEGRFRAGMDGYGRVLQAVGDSSHQSCLLLTSREAPPELPHLTRGRALELRGLGVVEAQTLLADKQLDGDERAWTSLVEQYGGNGLALKIVAETIRQVYAGDVRAFLTEVLAAHATVLGGVRRLLDVQTERLPAVERDILRRLAVEREPITLAELVTDMAPRVVRQRVVEGIETLRRRSLVERGERAATFTLQSMVLEYVTDRLVDTVADEIERGQPGVLIEQPLMKARTKDYVREAQERLIGAPILRCLRADSGEREAEHRLMALLNSWRGRPAAKQGYGPGNVTNLLRLLRGDLHAMDFSRLEIRQAYLALVDIQAGSLAGAHLAETVLADAFSDPPSVALSADGALLAVGTASGEVWLWSVADRIARSGTPTHEGAVWSVAFSSDGRLLASGGEDGRVRLRDTSSGREVTFVHGPAGGVWGVALSADGQLVASCGGDGAIRLWETSTGRPLRSLRGHEGVVRRVALSRDGQLLASGGGDGAVRIWETREGRALATLHGHSGGVFGLAMCTDGHLVASCSDDGTIRLWDSAPAEEGEIRTTVEGGRPSDNTAYASPNEWRPLATLRAHDGVVWRVALSNDGDLVASGGEDGVVRLWETRTGRPLGAFHGHTSEIQGVALSGDGRLVASCGLDTAVRLWDARTCRPVATLHGNPTIVADLALSADGFLLATQGSRGPRLWDTATGRQLTIPQGRADAIWRVALSADGRLLAGGGRNGTVMMWETHTGRQLATLHAHTGAIWSVALSADGRVVASGGGDGTVRVWESSTGRILATQRSGAGAIFRVALSADGRLVAGGGGDGTVRLWDTETAQALATLDGHTGSVFGVAMCADGHRMASCGDDGTVRLWESAHPPSEWRSLQTLRGHNGVVWRVALSADGEIVASSSFDGMLRVWEATTGRSLATIHGHTGTVLALALSADGQLLASGGSDGNVRLWEVSSGTCLRTLQSEGRYEGLDITGLTGVTEAQRSALLALGAVETSP